MVGWHITTDKIIIENYNDCFHSSTRDYNDRFPSTVISLTFRAFLSWIISCISERLSPPPAERKRSISSLSSRISRAFGSSFTWARLTIDRAFWAYLQKEINYFYLVIQYTQLMLIGHWLVDVTVWSTIDSRRQLIGQYWRSNHKIGHRLTYATVWYITDKQTKPSNWLPPTRRKHLIGHRLADGIICLVAPTNLSVESVSSRLRLDGLTVAIMAVRAFPPRLSFSRYVSTESRYGTKSLRFLARLACSDSTLITLPSTSRDLQRQTELVISWEKEIQVCTKQKSHDWNSWLKPLWIWIAMAEGECERAVWSPASRTGRGYPDWRGLEETSIQEWRDNGWR